MKNMMTYGYKECHTGSNLQCLQCFWWIVTIRILYDWVWSSPVALVPSSQILIWRMGEIIVRILMAKREIESCGNLIQVLSWLSRCSKGSLRNLLNLILHEHNSATVLCLLFYNFPLVSLPLFLSYCFSLFLILIYS